MTQPTKKADVPFDGPYKKAEGNVKDKSGAVHTPMSRARDLARQAMKKQMKEEYDLDISDDEADELVAESFINELSTNKLLNYRAAATKQIAGNPTPEKDIKRKAGIGRSGEKVKAKMKTEDLDENVNSERLTFSEFVSKINEQLAEYKSKEGVYVHKGSYGSSYQGDEDDEDEDAPKKKPVDAVKKGRGRPAGSKSGARQQGNGKSFGGFATHSLNLPSKK